MAHKGKTSEETTILRVLRSDIELYEKDENYGKPKKKQKTKVKSKKKKLIIAGSVLLSVVVLVSGLYLFLKDSSLPFYTYNIGDAVSNNSVETKILLFEKLDEIQNYEIQPEYDYFLIKYSYTNKTQNALEWGDFYPYINISEMKAEPKKVSLFDKYKSSLLQVETKEETFDFEALKYYSINNGIDFTTVKNELQPNETREDYDIVKLPKGKFETNSYFITIQDLKAAIPLNEQAFELAQQFTKNGTVLNNQFLLNNPD